LLIGNLFRCIFLENVQKTALFSASLFYGLWLVFTMKTREIFLHLIDEEYKISQEPFCELNLSPATRENLCRALKIKKMVYTPTLFRKVRSHSTKQEQLPSHTYLIMQIRNIWLGHQIQNTKGKGSEPLFTQSTWDQEENPPRVYFTCNYTIKWWLRIWFRAFMSKLKTKKELTTVTLPSMHTLTSHII
jgi:hypothetical protein